MFSCSIPGLLWTFGLPSFSFLICLRLDSMLGPRSNCAFSAPPRRCYSLNRRASPPFVDISDTTHHAYICIIHIVSYASYCIIHAHHHLHHTYICIIPFTSRLVDKHLDILGFIVSFYFFLSQLIIWSCSFFLAPNHLGVSSAAGRVSHGADSDISAAAGPTSSIDSSPIGSSDWRYIF